MLNFSVNIYLQKTFAMKSIANLLVLALLASNIFAQTYDPNKVTAFFQDQQYDEAIAYLKPIAQADSSNIPVLAYLAYAYNVSENSIAAARYYERILAVDSTNVSANQNLANLYLQRRETDAELLTERLIRLQPNRSIHYRNKGQLLDRRKVKDSAAAFFEKAYGLDSHDLRNVSAFADILIDTSNYVKADSILQAGLQLDSMYVPLLMSAIRSAYETEKYDEAITYGERLVAQQEVTIKPLTQLILAYYHLEQYAECIELCEYMRQQEIQTEAVKYYEAKAWAKLGKYERSNELLRECLASAIADRAEMYYYALADNAEETGNYTSAIANYDTAYYLFKAPLVKYNVGRIYQTKLKNTEVADKYFRKYLLLADTSKADEKKIYQYLRRRNFRK